MRTLPWMPLETTGFRVGFGAGFLTDVEVATDDDEVEVGVVEVRVSGEVRDDW